MWDNILSTSAYIQLRSMVRVMCVGKGVEFLPETKSLFDCKANDTLHKMGLY